MKITKVFKTLAAAMTFGVLAFGAVSCNDDDKTPVVPADSCIRGYVIDDNGSYVSDATVSVEGTEISAVTAVDGSFELKNVAVAEHKISIVKEGLATLSMTVKETSFKDKVADLGELIMNITAAVIKGKVIGSDEQGLEGVTVTLNGAATATTAADGSYEFTELILSDYELVFSMADCKDVKRHVTSSMFAPEHNYVVEPRTVVMGGGDVLPGRSIEDLLLLDTWHYNEYRGGRNGDDYPHFDWSSDYMCTLNGFYGWWEEQNEGTTIQIRNRFEEGHQENPRDMENFDSYLAGKKLITEDNCKMYLKVRTHAASADAPCHFAVMVVDPSSGAVPQAERIGDIRTYGNDNYTNEGNDFEFDLSKYVGKEVIVSVGTFRAETGDYWKQLVIRRMVFAKSMPSDWGWCPGTAVAGLDEGYKLTQEILRSTMPVTEFKEFTGVTDNAKVVELATLAGQDVPADYSGNRDNYYVAYQAWKTLGHFAAYWSCMPVKKDSEPFAGEGYVIKTRGGVEANLNVPEAYFYAKFAIAEGSNQFTLNTRTFSSDVPTFFRVTVITEDGQTVKHMEPAEGHGAAMAEAVENGVWKFCHEQGAADDPDSYAHFSYDLSEFNGQNVIITFGVFKGEQNDHENKMCIHSVALK